jgi:hypothetical protein
MPDSTAYPSDLSIIIRGVGRHAHKGKVADKISVDLTEGACLFVSISAYSFSTALWSCRFYYVRLISLTDSRGCVCGCGRRSTDVTSLGNEPEIDMTLF